MRFTQWSLLQYGEMMIDMLSCKTKSASFASRGRSTRRAQDELEVKIKGLAYGEISDFWRQRVQGCLYVTAERQ
jgi:hypothetical protein